MSDEYDSVDEAIAAVKAAYPDAESMPGLNGLYSSTLVYYDPQRHKVAVIGDGLEDTVHPAVYVDLIDGIDIAGELEVYDMLNDEALRGPFDYDGGDATAAVDEVARIYIESHMARLRGKEVEEDRLHNWLHFELEKTIAAMRKQIALLESVQLRVLHMVIRDETTPEGVEKALDRLNVTPEQLRDLILDDKRRFERLTIPLRIDES